MNHVYVKQLADRMTDFEIACKLDECSFYLYEVLHRIRTDIDGSKLDIFDKAATIAAYGYLFSEKLDEGGSAEFERIVESKINYATMMSNLRWPRIDGKTPKRGDVVCGESDNMPWRLLSYNVEDDPYVFECINLYTGKIKQLRCEWLRWTSDILDKDGKDIMIGDKIKDLDSEQYYIAQDVFKDRAGVSWVRVNSHLTIKAECLVRMNETRDLK